MTFADISRKMLKITSDNSPVILTTVGVVGTLTTAYLTGTATVKAVRILDDEVDASWGTPGADTIPLKDAVRMTWKCYIPAASTATVTVASIIMANRIGNKRAAAMAAAFTLSEKAYSEYREKVTEHLGKNKEQKVRDDIQQDRVQNTSSQIIVTDVARVLCYDKFSGRYFESSMEELKKAQNDLNYRVLNDYYASLSDFYDLLGVDRTSMSEELGWNSDELLELEFSTVMSDNQKPCIAIDFRVQPIRNYHRVH